MALGSSTLCKLSTQLFYLSSLARNNFRVKRAIVSGYPFGAFTCLERDDALNLQLVFGKKYASFIFIVYLFQLVVF